MAQHTIEDVLKQEAVSLEKMLAQRPEFQRLNIIRKTLMELQAVKSPDAHASSAPLLESKGSRTATSIVQATEFALNDNGHPLSTRELMEVLPAYGKTPSGKAPSTNLSNNLSTDKRFESIIWRGNKSWWLVGRPVPPE